jgi:hypothetical protein
MLAFIDDCRSFTALWDVNHKDYSNKIKRNYVFNAMAINYYKMSVNEVKNKIKSLRSYFAKEQQKVTGGGGKQPEDAPCCGDRNPLTIRNKKLTLT